MFQDLEHSGRGGGFRTSSSSSAVHSSPPSTASSRAGHGHAIGPLNVRKQRHSCTDRVSLATSSVVPAAKFRRGATMSYPPTFVRYPATCDADGAGLSIPSTRALSLATSRRDSSAHRVAHSPQQTSLKPQQQSTQLKNHDLGATSNKLMRRESSFKHRFLSRVMNSLTSRPSGNHPVAQENSSRRCSTEASARDGAADWSDTARRISISTVDTDSSIDTDLQTALDAFPEPPISNLTSPTDLTSFEHAQHDARAYRILRTPSDIAVVRPEVTITPEAEALTANANQTMHIAVQIGAVTEAMTKIPYDRAYGLDVAVVIDNS